ncbi:MAG: RHS repeat-associated core domain-containing protein [Cellvibrionales bacterium]|nr:RHS repeat-associated core domain-containing protein [Cellvibrionales bacterium]
MEQIDARGRSTITHRDILGREVCRVDYLDASHTAVESSSQWFYDTAPKPDNGNGQTIAIGQLHRVVKSNTACNSTPSYDANAQYPYEQMYHYDAFGRNNMTDTIIDGETFTTQVTYDEIGRTFQSFDAAGNDRGTRNIYNDQGYLSEIRDAQVYNNAQAVYRKILEMDARGNVTQEFSHNGMTTTRAYDPIHGMITEIYTALKGVLIAQDLIMHYDALGNLLRREDNKRSHYESFCYDALNRMTGSALNAQCTEGDIQYDSFGNFINKPNVGTYTYGEQAGPHAVTSTEKDGVITTYQYDANGNMVSDSTGRQLVYSQFDKPTQITKGQSKIEFDYGPGRSRYKRTDTDGENITTTLYLGNVEIITRNGVREAKRYIAGNTISTDTALNEAKAPQTARFQFMFKDHLGSVDIILTETPHEADGQILMSFDAWGLRRNATTLEDGFNLAEILNQSISATTRGFTGHEMLDLVGLIHMNGRVYDPLLGRFLSADPFIQSPTETQSYNRYAYVWNNPMSSTDPTGYWDNRKMMGIFGSILSTIGTVLIMTGAGAAIGMGLVMIGGAMVGKAQGNIMRGVVTAAFTAIASAGIAAGAQAASVANTAVHCAKGVITIGKLSLTAAQWGARILAQSVVGGVASAMQGGNFGNGFVAAGISSGLNIALPSTGNFAVGVIRSAAIGGTVSELTGGKFSNGARMSAYSYAAAYAASVSAENAKESEYSDQPYPDENYSDYKYRTTGQEVLAQNDKSYKLLISSLTADLEKINSCVDTCLKNTYGQTYEISKALSPLSAIGIGSTVATSELETKLETNANRNGWSGNHKTYMRQIRTLNQFKGFNAINAILGAGALGFQTGANLYCTAGCLNE